MHYIFSTESDLNGQEPRRRNRIVTNPKAVRKQHNAAYNLPYQQQQQQQQPQYGINDPRRETPL